MPATTVTDAVTAGRGGRGSCAGTRRPGPVDEGGEGGEVNRAKTPDRS